MFEPWHLPLLFGTGLVAGFVDSIAGGGGLISVPVLLSFGLDAPVALGTNKLQAAVGSGSAAWHYARAKTVPLEDCARGFVLSLLGAALGTLAVERVDPSFLKRFIPILLLAVALYTLLKPGLGDEDRRPRLAREWFDLAFGLGLGFYDGFFGPGTGSFWAMAYVMLLGLNLTRATAHTKLMNFASNAASLAIFIAGGKAHWDAGLVMGLGQLLGARLGAKMVVARGARFIRPIFIAVVLASAARLLVAAIRH